MRIDIDLPDDKEFQQALADAIKKSNRTRKNYIETIVMFVVLGNDKVLVNPEKSKKK